MVCSRRKMNCRIEYTKGMEHRALRRAVACVVTLRRGTNRWRGHPAPTGIAHSVVPACIGTFGLCRRAQARLVVHACTGAVSCARVHRRQAAHAAPQLNTEAISRQRLAPRRNSGPAQRLDRVEDFLRVAIDPDLPPFTNELPVAPDEEGRPFDSPHFLAVHVLHLDHLERRA